MTQQMSYAQALNEAKKVIVQQSTRIKNEIETIKSQQQMIVEQTSTLSERERELSEKAAALQEQMEAARALDERLKNEMNAREQAEAIVDRQGERVTSLQAQAGELEQRLREQAEIIAQLNSERDLLAAQVPSQEDEAALAEMSQILTTKRIPAAVARDLGAGRNEASITDEEVIEAKQKKSSRAVAKAA